GGGGIDAHGDGRVAGSDRTEGAILRALQRSGEPLFPHPGGGWAGESRTTEPGGKGAAGVGDSDDRGLLAAGTGTQRAAVWHLARALAAGTAPGPNHRGGGSQPVSAG